MCIRDRDKVLSLVKERLQAGNKPMEVINSLQEGMVEVGNLFEKGEFFLSELIFCGEIMKEAMEVLEPQLAAGDRESVSYTHLDVYKRQPMKVSKLSALVKSPVIPRMK